MGNTHATGRNEETNNVDVRGVEKGHRQRVKRREATYLLRAEVALAYLLASILQRSQFAARLGAAILRLIFGSEGLGGSEGLRGFPVGEVIANLGVEG